MNTKTILAISFAAAFAVSMMMLPAYAVGHLGITDTDVEIKSNAKGTNDRIKVHIEVGADIPLDGTSGAFGFGVFTGGVTDNVLVLATHLPIDDSNHEDPTSGFHTHVLDVIATTDACTNGFTHEVDLASSGMNKGFDLDADWEIDGDTAWIGFTPTKRLNSSTSVDFVAAFTITPVFDGPTLTNLCLTVTSAV
jgi:hypothetical protein